MKEGTRDRMTRSPLWCGQRRGGLRCALRVAAMIAVPLGVLHACATVGHTQEPAKERYVDQVEGARWDAGLGLVDRRQTVAVDEAVTASPQSATVTALKPLPRFKLPRHRTVMLRLMLTEVQPRLTTGYRAEDVSFTQVKEGGGMTFRADVRGNPDEALVLPTFTIGIGFFSSDVESLISSDVESLIGDPHTRPGDSETLDMFGFGARSRIAFDFSFSPVNRYFTAGPQVGLNFALSTLQGGDEDSLGDLAVDQYDAGAGYQVGLHGRLYYPLFGEPEGVYLDAAIGRLADTDGQSATETSVEFGARWGWFVAGVRSLQIDYPEGGSGSGRANGLFDVAKDQSVFVAVSFGGEE